MLVLLLLGCTRPGVVDSGTTPQDAAGCTRGEVADGEVCVPAACGVGAWGDLPVDADTVYVAAGADGEGTADDPLGSVQAAADRAGALGGALVAIGAGEYEGALSLGVEHDRVTIAGRCRELVTLVAEAGQGVPTIEIDGGSRLPLPTFAVEGVTVTGGEVGVWVDHAAATLRRVSADRNVAVGVLVRGDSEVSMEESDVLDTQTTEDGTFGDGIEVTSGAALTVQGGTVRGNASRGVLVTGSGSSAVLTGVAVLETVADGSGQRGWGVAAFAGGAATVASCSIEGNTQAGVVVSGSGSSIELSDSVVADTVPAAEGTGGVGVTVEAEAALVATGCLVRANAEAGVLVTGAGSTASLTDVTVADTLGLAGGLHGYGVAVQEGGALAVTQSTIRDGAGVGLFVDGSLGAQVVATGCTLEGNTREGVFATGEGAILTLEEVVVRGTRPDADGGWGRGIGVQDGVNLVVRGATIEGNSEVGLFASDAGTSVEIHDSRIVGTTPGPGGEGQGVAVLGGAALSAVGLVLERNSRVGLYASDEGTTVDLVESQVLTTSASPDSDAGGGVEVQAGAALSALGCRLEGNANRGLVAFDLGTTVVLEDTRIEGTTSLPDGSGGRGLDVEDGARLSASGCSIVGNTEVGVLAIGRATEVHLVDTEVVETRRGRVTAVALGVAAQAQAVVTATGCRVEGTAGPGVYVLASAAVALEDCEVLANGFAGVVALGGGVSLEGVRIAETTADAEWGGGIGLYASAAAGAGSARVARSVVETHPYAGVWLDGNGAFIIEDSHLSGGAGFDLSGSRVHGNAVFAERGVTAWDGTVGLRLARNVISEASLAAVLLDGATAQLEDNEWAGNGVDVWQQRCGETVPLAAEGLAGVPTVVLCPVGNLLTDRSLTLDTLYLSESAPE